MARESVRGTVETELIRADLPLIDYWLDRARADLRSIHHEPDTVWEWIDRLLDRRNTLTGDTP